MSLPKRARARAQSVSAAALALGLGLLPSCRCKKETLAPVDVGTNFDPGEVGREDLLAPTWGSIQQGTLDNGAVLQWLHEAQAGSFHVRVLLPTSSRSEQLDGASMAVMLRALEMRIKSRIRRLDAELRIEDAPGRVEVSLHGRDDDAETLLSILAQGFTSEKIAGVLPRAQGKVVAEHRTVGSSELAAAALAARLLGLELSHEHATRDHLVSLSVERLERAWSTLVEPRDAIIIVHTHRSPESLASSMERLSSKWRGRGRRSAKGSTIDRLRDHLAPPKIRTTLLGDVQPSPLYVVEGGRTERSGRPVVMLGRIIPTPDPKSRARARLVQRVLQEELDARLVVAGDVSLFAIRLKLSPSTPLASLERGLERLQDIVGKAQRSDRIQLAAKLWLGARVVDASLNGEDWTSLWSESIDLADEDRKIPDALAQDALEMLTTSPDELLEFQAKWFNPKGGEPGWTWVVAGLDANAATSLEERVRVEPLPATPPRR